MSRSTFPMISLAILMALAAGCARESSNPVDRAVDKTKDALDMRSNEKIKDAAEDVQDAAKDASQGIKDAAHDATQQAKDAANGSSH
jgi:gas vesicle protein